MLRSCYSARVRFYSDQPARVHRIQWYWAEKTAKDMPFSTAFGTEIYDGKEFPPGQVGETHAPHTWTGGQPPYQVSSVGLCGTQEQWQTGCTAADPVPAMWPGTAIPRCCGRPPERGVGGVAYGGQVLIPIVALGGEGNAGQVAVLNPVIPLGGEGYWGWVGSPREALGGYGYGGIVRVETPTIPPECECPYLCDCDDCA